MRWLNLTLVILCCAATLVKGFEDGNLEDDDFAEFEQFDAEEEIPILGDTIDTKEVPSKIPLKSTEEPDSIVETEDEILVEEDDNEFEHFQDPEEFEGFHDNTPKPSEQPKITISKVPITVHRLDAYWLEGILCILLAAYALAYTAGRSKNTSIAVNFLKMHKPLLQENFTLVGEKGSDTISCDDEGGWNREAEHCFTMWCSGRVCCEGMLLTLRLIKRQDLVNVVMNFVRPSPDTLQIRIELDKEDMDPFVLCIGQKKHVTRLSKEMQDLSIFCPERRPGEKHGLPSSMAVLSEAGEACAALLDGRALAVINQHHSKIQYIHISDSYCGPKQIEETTPTKPPDTERVMLISFTLEDESARPLLQLVFHLLDKLKRLRLSKEVLMKCEKRRQKVAEAWQRGAHAARQEQAAQRREEKRKIEKEKILAEDDPEKQRRWELKEQKRQQKRKNPKMKQLKVRAL